MGNAGNGKNPEPIRADNWTPLNTSTAIPNSDREWDVPESKGEQTGIKWYDPANSTLRSEVFRGVQLPVIAYGSSVPLRVMEK